MLRPDIKNKQESNDKTLPKSGENCFVLHGGQPVPGRVVHYFDHVNEVTNENEEFVLVNLGVVHVVRKVTDIIKPGG